MSTKIEDKPIAHAGADSSPRCDVSYGSVTYALFKHMADEHGLTLLESELAEIVRLVNDTLDERLRWWITNAEGIALERYDLLKTLREIRDQRPSMEWQAKIIDAAIERNSPNMEVSHGRAKP